MLFFPTSSFVNWSLSRPYGPIFFLRAVHPGTKNSVKCLRTSTHTSVEGLFVFFLFSYYDYVALSFNNYI